MKARIIFVFLLAFLLFGCVSEETFASAKKESLSNQNEYDIDGDGVWDYAIYSFKPVKLNDRALAERTVAVANLRQAQYKSFNNLTDLYIQKIDGDLTNFQLQKNQDAQACIKKLGLSEGKCITLNTCTSLCSLASEKCKNAVANYPEIIGKGMIYYQNRMDGLDNSLTNARIILPQTVRNENDEKRGIFLDYVFEMRNDIVAANTNPLLFAPPTAICERNDYGIEKLLEAAKKIGEYDTETTRYIYTVMIKVVNKGVAFSTQPISITIEDEIPFNTNIDEIIGYQTIAKTKTNGSVTVKWVYSSLKPQPYLLIYSFASEKPPQTYFESLTAPTTKITYADLTLLGLLNSLFLDVFALTNSHYFAAGFVCGLALSASMLFFTLLSLLFTMVRAALNKKSIYDGIARMLSKTPVRWRLSIGAGAILIMISFVLVGYLVPEPFAITSLLDMMKFDFENPGAVVVNIVGFLLATTGTILVYDGIENFVKVMLLDKYFGAVRRTRREEYMKQIAQLKESVKRLKELIEKAYEKNFNVDEEKTVAASVSAQKISLLERKMTPENVAEVAEDLNRISAATEALEEKIKIAEENWLQWRTLIEKNLEEKNEVGPSSLQAVPADLRVWALSKYAAEHSPEEITYEKDVLRRKKITAPTMVKELTKRGVIKGALLIQNEQIVASCLEGDKSATAASVLLLRLRAYLYSLAKAMKTEEVPASFVSVGKNTVFIITKMGRYEAALILPRDKFKEGYDQFREKIKLASE